MSWGDFFKVVETIGPQILVFTPLAPIALPVAQGIALAHSIPGATDDQKKAIVAQIVATGVAATNAQAGKQVIDPAVATAATSDVFDLVSKIAETIHASPVAVLPQVQATAG